MGVDRAVGLPRRHAADDVADGDAAGAAVLRFAERRERIGSLSGLRDDDRERVRRYDRTAIAILGAVVDFDRNLRSVVEHELADEPRVPRRAARNDMNSLDLRPLFRSEHPPHITRLHRMHIPAFQPGARPEAARESLAGARPLRLRDACAREPGDEIYPIACADRVGRIDDDGSFRSLVEPGERLGALTHGEDERGRSPESRQAIAVQQVHGEARAAQRPGRRVQDRAIVLLLSRREALLAVDAEHGLSHEP